MSGGEKKSWCVSIALPLLGCRGLDNNTDVCMGGAYVAEEREREQEEQEEEEEHDEQQQEQEQEESGGALGAWRKNQYAKTVLSHY